MRLIVEPDYGQAFPLWIEGGENDPDVPLSDGLRRALKEWAAEWENAAWNDPGSPDRVLASTERNDFDAWVRAGKTLADRVQMEVGADYEVLYGQEHDDG